MDLVCERIARWMPRRRASADRAGPSREEHCRVRLPNPRYPMPEPALIRLHGQGDFRAAASWGAAGADSLDIALNVMAAYLPFRISDRHGAVRASEGAIVSRQAALHYPAFCKAFVESMAAEGGVVSEATIRAWLAQREPRASAD